MDYGALPAEPGHISLAMIGGRRDHTEVRALRRRIRLEKRLLQFLGTE